MPKTPAHLDDYMQWMASGAAQKKTERGRPYAAQTCSEYTHFLRKYAERFNLEINERTVSNEDAVQRILSVARREVEKLGRTTETFRLVDVNSNLQSTLRLYAKFVTVTGRTCMPNEPVALDVPVAKLPKGLRQQVSRLIRNTKVTREVKALYDGQCQVCGERLEISPGKFYCEGHHLRPLGKPHDGDDRKENVICVCPNCHALLDFNARPIEPTTLKIKKHEIGQEYIEYHNRHCGVTS